MSKPELDYVTLQRRLARAPSQLKERPDQPCNCPACIEDAQHLVRPLYLRVRGA